jgi:hypothetical protein
MWIKIPIEVGLFYFHRKWKTETLSSLIIALLKYDSQVLEKDNFAL